MSWVVVAVGGLWFGRSWWLGGSMVTMTRGGLCRESVEGHGSGGDQCRADCEVGVVSGWENVYFL